jgi:subtilisin family serine protease
MQARILLSLLCVSYALAAAPILGRGLPNAIAGRYIVVFHPTITEEAKNTHLINFQDKIHHTYEIESFKGFAADLTDAEVEALKENADVKYIEADQKVSIARMMRPDANNLTASCTTQQNAIWGLNRVSESALLLNGLYKYVSTAGSGVNAYVIDTGILTTHVEFEGRAVWGNNFVNDGKNTDCQGHGTHVAGTIGGVTYGIAKKVTLIAVKVLGCDGSGTNAGVIAGINWVTSQHKSKGKPSVANMSLGGGISTAVDDATAQSIIAGVSHAVAAGNENTNACNGSPARVATAITVGATTVDDKGTKELDARASFSNFGKCVSLFAPGQLIKSAWIGSNTATNTISGTSMATPHVAGVVALKLAAAPSATPAAIKSALLSEASKNLINLLCKDTTCSASPNLLLYNPCK